MNGLYRNAGKEAASGFVFDETVLKAALKRIYEKEFSPMTGIDEGLFNAFWQTYNKAVDEGFTAAGVFDRDAAFIEEIKRNNAVFAAFKTHRMQNDIAGQLLDEKEQLKSFGQWKSDTAEMVDHHTGSWLRTEYDTAVIRAHQAADWRQFQQEADILPNLEWMPSTSITPGKDHQVFWGLTLPINHPFWNEHRPGDRWNCKCSLSSTDRTATPEDGIPDSGEDGAPSPGLGGNPGETGRLFSDDHPYIKNAHKGANEAVMRFIEQMKKEQLSPNLPKELHPEGVYLKGKNIVFKRGFFDLIDNTPGRDIRFKIDKRGSNSYFMPDTARAVLNGKTIDVPENMRRMVHIADNTRNLLSDWHREVVIYHEFGHAIDSQRKLYAGAEIKTLMDRQRILLSQKATYKIYAPGWDSDKMGLVFKRQTMEISRFEYLDRKLIDLRARINKMDAQTFKRLGITRDDAVEQIGSLADTIGSLNPNYGWGHTKKYYASPSMSEKEFIAHCFENAFAGNRVFKKYLPELYGEMIGYVKSLR